MSETVRANSNNGFLQKYLLITIVCLAFGFWHLYDATIGYPNKAQRSLAYEKIQELELTEAEKGQRWEAVAKENGWSHAEPETSSEEWMAKVYWWQYPVAVISFLIAIPVLFNYVRSRNSWVESDGRKLTTSWGRTLNFDKIEEINKRKWEAKGIAKIRYVDGTTKKSFVLDDFKYDRQAMAEIMSHIESVAGEDRVTRGRTQREIGTRVSDSDADVPDEPDE